MRASDIRRLRSPLAYSQARRRAWAVAAGDNDAAAAAAAADDYAADDDGIAADDASINVRFAEASSIGCRLRLSAGCLQARWTASKKCTRAKSTLEADHGSKMLHQESGRVSANVVRNPDEQVTSGGTGSLRLGALELVIC